MSRVNPDPDPVGLSLRVLELMKKIQNLPIELSTS